MAIDLMGAGYVPDTVIAHGFHTSTVLGISVYNVGTFSTVILGKNADGSYLAHIDVYGKHMEASTAETFPWIAVSVITAKAKELTGTNKCILLGGRIPFYSQEIITSDNYGAAMSINNDDNYLMAGRVYTEDGNFGAYPMKTLKTGRYAFGVFAKCWNE